MMRRVGFWRALLDITLLVALVTLAYYGLARLSGPPLAEIVSFGVYLVFGYGAWRLAPGRGEQLQRIGRALGWATLAGLSAGLPSYLVHLWLPFNRPFLGNQPELLKSFDPGTWLAIYALSSLICFVPPRLLLVVANWGALRRLRWRLTLSYVLLGSLTTLLIFSVLGGSIALINASDTAVPITPATQAERVAGTLRPLLLRNAGDAELQRTLQGLLSGEVRLLVPSAEQPDSLTLSTPLRGIDELLLFAPDGTLRASSNLQREAGAELSYDEQLAWSTLLEATATDCVSAAPSRGILADAALCPIRNDNGSLLGFLALETIASQPGAQVGAELGLRVGAFFAVVGSAIIGLAIAAPVIMVMSSIFGYLLARGLTRRVEKLVEAAHSLAAGDLKQRVAIAGEDEIGRLGSDFNVMADRLEEREQALEAEKARAERLLEANRQLIAGVSHELRTPVTVIRGYVEALDQQYGEQLPNRDLQVIQREIDRLTALIEDLFTLARAEVQQLPLAITAVDVAGLASELVGALAPLAQRERRVEVIAQLAPDLPAAYADRARLAQVLTNLLQNALRHTPEGGIVVVEGHSADDSVWLCVADTGVGIPPDELPHIFERFYRGDSSRARETGGAGLGLALVKELSEAMGGSVRAESQPGRGSRFSITLRKAP